ncbi:uncharacterized protein [Montipora foliosa]|uniref:uncharacterized protein isoform X1 n=1 Tax=Montipora foliosa TaxID=591990 RepID=UPI0035F20AEF
MDTNRLLIHFVRINPFFNVSSTDCLISAYIGIMSNSNDVADLLRRAASMLRNGNAASSSTSPQSSTAGDEPRGGIIPGPSGSNNVTAAVQEHRRLFNRQLRIQPYADRRVQTSARTGGRSSTKEKTFTRTIVCLADKQQITVPSSDDKIHLRNNFLEEKKVAIPTTASKQRVKEVLYEAFPPLKSCGGFEMLLAHEKSRTKLRVVNYGSCSADELRCLGTGRIYLRPIQKDIVLGDEDDSDDQFEDCFICKVAIPLRQMRTHMDLCMVGSSSTITINDDNASSSSHESLPPAFDDKREEEQEECEREPSNQEHANPPEQQPDSLPAVTPDHDQQLADQGETARREEENIPYKEHLRRAVKETLQTMVTYNDPVTVLAEFRRRLLRGRKLDLESDSELCEGDTTEIFISLFNLFHDAMEEVLREDVIDYSLPLEVTFTGESAQDYGGPRRQFLGSIMREIRDRLFLEQNHELLLSEDLAALENQHYFGAGLFFGFSLLQGGPLPTFLAEEQIQRIFAKGDLCSLSRDEIQFRAGLEKFGLIELFHGKPCLVFLFRKTAVLPLTYAKLVKLLEPMFSKQGTSRRQQEERTYRLFLNYLKEVAAGRRADGNISLGNILKFVTGSENEPVLGFQMKPSISFDAGMPSCLPISNTCINGLSLPVGGIVPNDKVDAFSFFDYAFLNDFFGRM